MLEREICSKLISFADIVCILSVGDKMALRYYMSATLGYVGDFAYCLNISIMERDMR